MKVKLNSLGKRIINNIPHDTSLVVVEHLRECNCGFDPDDSYSHSQHDVSCSSRYIVVRLPDGREILEKKVVFKVL